MACATLRWPAFAELDRRLYSLYDIQFLEVVRELPPGFLYGIGPNSPAQPADSQEIGLTVAGVAACKNTNEIMARFVEFIQMATAKEKSWQPPAGQPDGMPSLSDAEFASGARGLPAAGREHLLGLLFLILKTEAAGWAGLSHDPASGQWTVHLGRHIRDFANVRDIGDYWSRRYKPWQTRRTAPAPATPASGAAAPGVSYTFHAPVTGASFAVGDHATQHAKVGNAGAGNAGGPSGPRSDTIKAAWIAGWFVIAAAVIGAVLAAFFTNGFGLVSASSPRTTSPTAQAIERRYDGKDPQGKNGRRCADPPPSQPVSQIHPSVIGPSGAVVGHVELRNSPICPVIWARVTWLNASYAMPAGWSLHIVMYRRVDPASAPYVSHDTSNYVYGNMLATVRGCVYAKVYFANGRSHTRPTVTGCFRST